MIKSSQTTVSAPVRGHWLAAWLGFAFLLMHIAFNVAQSRVTTLYPALGFVSLALIYLGFGSGSIVAPLVIPKYISAPRWVFFLGGVCYSLFAVGTNLGGAVLLVASLTAGFSGGLLWFQLSMYLARLSEIGGGEIGKITTIFYGLSAFNMVIGNYMGFQLGLDGYSTSFILWVAAGIGACSCLCFVPVATLPPVTPPSSQSSLDLPQVSDPLAEMNLFRKIWTVWNATPVRELTPLLLFSGTFNTLVLGSLPLYLPRTSTGATDPSDLALLFMAYGACAGLFSPLWGPFFDRGGPRALSGLHAFISTVAYSLLLCVLVPGPGGFPEVPGLQRIFLLTVAGLFGALDTCTSTLINACIALYVKPQFNGSDLAMATGYSIVRINYCIAFILLSVLSSILPTGTSPDAWVPQLTLNILLFAGAVVYMIKLTMLGGAMAHKPINGAAEYKCMAETDKPRLEFIY